MSTKELVTNVLRAISKKPMTRLEIANATNTSASFVEWIIKSTRYSGLFDETIPNGFNPALISPSQKGRQFLADITENQNNLL